MPTYAERSEQKATGKKRMVLYGGFLFSIFCCFVASVTLVLILRNQYLAHTQEGIVSSTLLLEVKWTYEAESVVSDPPWYTDDVVLVRSRLPNSEDLPNLKEADTWIDAVDLETGRRQWGFARHSIGVRRPNWQELDAGNQIAVLTYWTLAKATLTTE